MAEEDGMKILGYFFARFTGSKSWISRFGKSSSSRFVTKHGVAILHRKKPANEVRAHRFEVKVTEDSESIAYSCINLEGQLLVEDLHSSNFLQIC